MEDNFNKALENFAAGKYLNARAYCLRALRLKERDAKEIYFLLGLTESELGSWVTEWDINDTIAACVYFDKVIRLEPDCAAAYFQRGRAILRWGNNYRLALENFEKVLELDPDNEAARRYCEICREKKEKYVDDYYGEPWADDLWEDD